MDSADTKLAWEVLLPCVTGGALIWAGYRIASFGLLAVCFLVGAVLGGAITQIVFVQLDANMQQQYWWAPLASAGACGIISAIVLKKVMHVLFFVAALAVGALLKLEIAPEQYMLPVGDTDLSPFVGGLVFAVALYVLRRPAVAVLTSILGASLIARSLQWPSVVVVLGAAFGAYLQWVAPALRSRKKRQLRSRT